MERQKHWQNTTDIKHNGKHYYGLSKNTTAVSSLQIHQVSHTKQMDSKQILIYLTFSTFDSQWVLLENENQTGKFFNQNLSFRQRIKIRTDFTIANCHLEHNYNEKDRKDDLIAYLIDIFGNLYTFNLSTQFTYHQKLLMPQPVKYTILHRSTSFDLLKDNRKIYLEHPMLLTKEQQFVTTVSLGGILKIFDMKKFNDKSWLVNTMPIEPEVFEFSNHCLGAATSISRSSLGHVIILILKNNQPPYPFINCTSTLEYQQKSKQINDFYTQGGDQAHQLVYVDFDATTNLVVTSTNKQEIQLYEIKKVKKQFNYCQKLLRFHPQGLELHSNMIIQSISANKGFLAIAYSQQYTIFNLETKIIIKRGKGNTKQNQIQKVKWIKVIDRHQKYLAFTLIKGYNHLNPQQSKLGKPNLHFKTVEIKQK